MRKTLISLIFIVIVFVITTIGVSLSLINSDNYLKNFSIISVDNISTSYHIKFEKVKAAKYYEVVIYNNDNKDMFYNNVFYDNDINIDLKNIKYNQEYMLVIFAYDELDDSITVKNPYVFTYHEPTFSNNNNLVLEDNVDYYLNIDGNIEAKDYLITINDGNYVLKKEKLSSNEYIISSKLFSGSNQKLTAKIYNGKSVVNEIDLYNNLSPISDLKITMPIEGSTLDYNDVTVNFEGGENATKYVVLIYKGDLLLKETAISDHRFIISSEFFNKSETYKIRIKAYYDGYDNYTKEAEVSFKMNEKDTLKPAFINLNYKYVSSGSKIIINNPNKDGKIYYTLDGSNPVDNGILYEEPIEVTENVLLKTVIKEKKKNDSLVSEYNINVGNKKEYRVYLSPSNQSGNVGVKSVGYTNEMAEMNDLSDYIEARLKEMGVKVYRNNPNGNINLWTADSRFYGADVHLAVHSNGSTDHTASGVETWINDESCAAYDLGNIIQNDLFSIYYDKDNPTKNRGVKYANGSLGEVNTRFVPLGVLVEIAHHDNLEDASWIMTNKKLIGETIANSILKYFGII